jgi:hypothetical protein
MSPTAIFWTVYLVGYFGWFAYAINRFIPANDLGNGDEIWHALLALLWPGCVAVYAPYRIVRWAGVRPDTVRPSSSKTRHG